MICDPGKVQKTDGSNGGNGVEGTVNIVVLPLKQM